MREKTNKILVGTGITAIGLTAVCVSSFALTKYLVRIAMDREMPKHMEKSKKQLTGSAEKNVEVINALGIAAQKLRNSECERVEIISHDGIKLIGHFKTCDNPKRVIIAMHGWRSSWEKDFGAISDFWHDNGCCVLYAEQRGQNESDGDYMGFGLIERYDCLDWIHWVNDKLGAFLPIYLGGVSMGASTVLMTSGLELPENVHGIVADCGYTSPHEIWKHVVENNLHISYGPHSSIADELCRKKIQIGTKDYSTVQALQQNKIPVLFIHGTDDHFVPIEMTYENYKACAAPKRLLVVPGAEHGMSYIVDKAGYEDAVKAFWHDYD